MLGDRPGANQTVFRLEKHLEIWRNVIRDEGRNPDAEIDEVSRSKFERNAPGNQRLCIHGGTPASLQITFSCDLCCLTSSSTRRSDVPTAMNPPTIIVAPLGINATASSTETLLMLMAPMVTAANGEPFASIQKLGAG